VTPHNDAGSTVFIVEDDASVRDSLVTLFEMSNLQVEAFASGKEFLSRYDPKRRGCLVLDVNLPGMSGTELHDRLTAAGTTIPTVFLTGHAPPAVSEEARRRGVVAVFEKPCMPEKLIDAVRDAIGTFE
jgi:two-component system, LuxR family, response regulator FixJ